MQLNSPDIHVWEINISSHQDLLKHADAMLSQDEKMRCKEYQLHPHQSRFMIMRIALRMIISDYLFISPDTIQFIYNKNGKPMIADQHANLHFNLSHSHSLGVIGIAKQTIGIDVERIRQCDVLNIAKRFFHPDEYQYLSELKIDEQAENFCQLWAKKEAVIKAMGASFASYAKQFAILSQMTSTTLNIQDRDWYLKSLDLAPDYKGALASVYPIKNVSLYRF